MSAFGGGRRSVSDDGQIRARATNVQQELDRGAAAGESGARRVLFALRNASGPLEVERAYRFVDDVAETDWTFICAMKPLGATRAGFLLLCRVIGRQVRANINRIRVWSRVLWPRKADVDVAATVATWSERSG